MKDEEKQKHLSLIHPSSFILHPLGLILYRYEDRNLWLDNQFLMG